MICPLSEAGRRRWTRRRRRTRPPLETGKSCRRPYGFEQADALPLHTPAVRKAAFSGCGRKGALLWQGEVAGEVCQRPHDLRCGGTGQQRPLAPRHRRISSCGFVFALDSPHIYDVEWLRGTAEKISEMKVSGAVPADCQEFIHILRDDQSEFCFPLGILWLTAQTRGASPLNSTKQTILPGNRLPEDGIVPFCWKPGRKTDTCSAYTDSRKILSSMIVEKELRTAMNPSIQNRIISTRQK